MAEGYFNDGTVNIELGEHVFATPLGNRRNVVLEPHDAAAVVLDSGGGMLDIEVTGQRVRDNLGDAEAYIYNLFLALATSEPGYLGCEDNRGYRYVFRDAVCVSARGEVQAFKMADMDLRFACAESPELPAWGAVPASPATYPGTSTLQDYAMGGRSLGTGGSMRIEMSRAWPVREVPRARGARTSIPPRGAVMRFVVFAATLGDADPLLFAIRRATQRLGPRAADLTANGNTFADVVLEGTRPRHTDRKQTMVEFEFIQQI